MLPITFPPDESSILGPKEEPKGGESHGNTEESKKRKEALVIEGFWGFGAMTGIVDVGIQGRGDAADRVVRGTRGEVVHRKGSRQRWHTGNSCLKCYNEEVESARAEALAQALKIVQL